MYTSLIDPEKIRLVVVTTCSALLSFFTPASHFIIALFIMFFLHIFCGMRADGVAITRCNNFSMSKFKDSLWELLLFVSIDLAAFSIMTLCGDESAAVISVKTLTYIFMYVYTTNAFKNLIKVYPKSKALRIIYHVLRLEFKRALPSHVQEIVDRVEEEENKEPKVQSNN